MIFVSVCPTGYKVLLKRVLTVSPAFVSQIAKKIPYSQVIRQYVRWGRIAVSTVEAWSCMRLQKVLDALHCSSLFVFEEQYVVVQLCDRIPNNKMMK